MCISKKNIRNNNNMHTDFQKNLTDIMIIAMNNKYIKQNCA